MFKYLTKKNIFFLYLLALSFLFTSSFIFSTIQSLINENAYLTNPNINYNDSINTLKSFVKSVVLAPLIETFIYQFIIFKVSKLLIKNNKLSLIVFLIISSLSFGFSHFYSPSYLLYTIFSGFIFAFFYEIFHMKKANSFLLITLIHLTYNLILFLTNIIYN